MHQILDGARACFVERGFHASSIAQISAAAQVSPANIYQYYPSKEALVVALIEEDLKRHLDMIYRLVATDFRYDTIKAAFSDLFTTQEGHKIAVMRAEIASEGSRNSDVARMLRNSESTLVKAMYRGVRSAQENGRAPADVDTAEAVERISLAFEGIMRLYVFSPEEGESLLDRLCVQVSKTFYFND
jgi:AcrR family transcriptional regulator